MGSRSLTHTLPVYDRYLANGSLLEKKNKPNSIANSGRHRCVELQVAKSTHASFKYGYTWKLICKKVSDIILVGS